MHRRISSTFLTLLCVTYLSFGVANAADKTLSLVASNGQSTIVLEQGDSIAIEVRVDDASAIAGASFTVTYDTANLTLASVESNFFDTFVNQNIPTPSDQGFVTVDSTDYYSPLVANKSVAWVVLSLQEACSQLPGLTMVQGQMSHYSQCISPLAVARGRILFPLFNQKLTIPMPDIVLPGN